MLKTICFSNTGCSAEDEDFLRLMRILGAERTQNIFEADCIVQHFCGMSTENYEVIPKCMFVLEKIKEERPEVKIFVGGCASEVLNFQKRYPFVDGVFARRHMIEDLSQYLGFDPECDKEPICNHNAVRIQSGCLRQCGFCKKHYMSMPLISKPLEQVIKDVKEVLKNGHSEVILLAENSTEYGIDLGYRLIDLLKELENKTQIERICLTALCIDELVLMPELVDYIADHKEIVSVQIEIQSLIPLVRKNMRLTSTREEVLKICKRFSKKRITTNIMVGYPGENKVDFDEQLDLIKENGLYYIQVNEFDATPGTPGYEMEQINPSIVQKRLLKMMNLLTLLKREKANGMINSAQKGYTGVAMGKGTLLLNGESILVSVNEDIELTYGKEYMVKVTGVDQLFTGKEQNMRLKGVLL
ncbi:MAG: radical SAM protein [Clostridia bacterium]|nr:radical SAM protein [Clostridia bacterium]